MNKINFEEHKLREQIESIRTKIFNFLQLELQKIQQKQKIIENLNPAIVLKRGYAIIHGQLLENAIVHLETETHQAEAKIIKVKNKE